MSADIKRRNVLSLYLLLFPQMGNLYSKVKSVTGIGDNSLSDTNVTEESSQVESKVNVDESSVNGHREEVANGGGTSGDDDDDDENQEATSSQPQPSSDGIVTNGDDTSSNHHHPARSSHSIDADDTEEEDSQALFHISSTTNHLEQEESLDSLVVNVNSTIGSVNSIINGSSNGHDHNEDSSVNGSRLSDNDEDGKSTQGSSIAESEASDIMRTSTPTKRRGKRSKSSSKSKRAKIEDDRKFACNQPNCGWSFKALFHLNRHRKNVHGINEPVTAAAYTLMQQQQRELDDPTMNQYLNQMMPEDQHSLSAF